MTKTNLQLVNFINFARLYAGQHPEQTKFRYALERTEKRLEKAIQTYSDALSDLQIEHAATDEKGALLTDDKGGFRYTKDGLRGRNKGQRDLLQTNIAEFEPYYATELPENLSQIEKEVCAGFVIAEEDAAPKAEAA